MIYRRFLGRRNGVSIWLVDGFAVRNYFDVDFSQGGHDLVKKYIPAGEVWIEKEISPEERKFIVLHEMKERGLMEKGFSYSKAHTQANRLERKSREVTL